MEICPKIENLPKSAQIWFKISKFLSKIFDQPLEFGG